MTSVLIKPIITEKSMQDASIGRYTFMVKKEANKAEIAHDVTSGFGVKALGVKTMIFKGKNRRTGKTRQEVKTSPWKKAVVQVAEGQKIELFDVTESPSPK